MKRQPAYRILKVAKPTVRIIAKSYHYEAHPWGVGATRFIVIFGDYSWERVVQGHKNINDCIALWADAKERKQFLLTKDCPKPVPDDIALAGFIRPATSIA